MKRPLLNRMIYDISRFIAWSLFKVFFRGKWSGHENLPKSGGALVCSNHQSAIDPILVGIGIPGHLNYLAKESLFRSKLFASFIRCYNAIPIQREGKGIGGLKETLRRLKKGGKVVIFPEGTRTNDGQIMPLKPGFCSMVRRGKVPIVPVAIHGAFDAFPRKRKLPRFAKIGVHYGPLISQSKIETMSDEELTSYLHTKLKEYLVVAKGLNHG